MFGNTQDKNMGKLYILPEDIQDMIHNYICRSWQERMCIEYSKYTWEHYLNVDWTLTFEEQFEDYQDEIEEEKRWEREERHRFDEMD
jgi:hypothetical protein